MSAALPDAGAPASAGPGVAAAAPRTRRRWRLLRWAVPVGVVALAAGWAVAGPLPVSWRVAVTVERVSTPPGPLIGASELQSEVRGMSNIARAGPRFRVRSDQPAREVVVRVRPRFGRILPAYDSLDLVWEQLDGTPVLMRVNGSVMGERRIDEGDIAESLLYRTQTRVSSAWQRLRQVVWPVKTGEDFPGRFRASEVVIVHRLQVQPGFQDARVRVRFVGNARTGPAPSTPPTPPLASSGDRVIAEAWSPPFRLIERAPPPAKPQPRVPAGSVMPPEEPVPTAPK